MGSKKIVYLVLVLMILLLAGGGIFGFNKISKLTEINSQLEAENTNLENMNRDYKINMTNAQGRVTDLENLSGMGIVQLQTGYKNWGCEQGSGPEYEFKCKNLEVVNKNDTDKLFWVNDENNEKTEIMDLPGKVDYVAVSSNGTNMLVSVASQNKWKVWTYGFGISADSPPRISQPQLAEICEWTITRGVSARRIISCKDIELRENSRYLEMDFSDGSLNYVLK